MLRADSAPSRVPISGGRGPGRMLNLTAADGTLFSAFTATASGLAGSTPPRLHPGTIDGPDLAVS